MPLLAISIIWWANSLLKGLYFRYLWVKIIAMMNSFFKQRPGRIPVKEMRKNVFLYGTICCVFYILFLLLMKAANLMQFTQLRFVNYLILFFVCMYEIRSWMNKNGTYVPFLQVFGGAYLTGIWSFLLFSAFLFVYTKFDPELANLFTQYAHPYSESVPTAVILFEGSAISIIVAYINMQYFRRYEEGEAPIPKKHSQFKAQNQTKI